MSHIIIKQINGKYSVWTTICDNFILVNGTIKDLIKLQMETYNKKVAKERVEKILNNLERHGPFSKISDRLEIIKEIHGKKEMKRVIKAIDKNKTKYI